MTINIPKIFLFEKIENNQNKLMFSKVILRTTILCNRIKSLNEFKVICLPAGLDTIRCLKGNKSLLFSQLIKNQLAVSEKRERTKVNFESCMFIRIISDYLVRSLRMCYLFYI